MAKKFTNELAEKALDQALKNNSTLVERRNQLYKERDAVEANQIQIEEDLSQERKQVGHLPETMELSVEGANNHANACTEKIEALMKAESAGKRKLTIIRSALIDIQPEIVASEVQIEQCRTTLAAAFERHILASPELRGALPLLQKVWATWAMSMDSPWFDQTSWAPSLINEPTDGDYSEAKKLMRIEDA